jgi:hypothetical protein
VERTKSVLDELTREDFAEELGSLFGVLPQAGPPLELVLIEVADLRRRGWPRKPSSGREPFSLLFRGPIEPILPQAIYRMEHASMGVLELFIAPLGPEGGGLLYEAVFN